jgi:hypothetical protein
MSKTKYMIAAAIAVILLAVSPVRGQQSREITPQLALATLTWSEAGLVSRQELNGRVRWGQDGDMRAIHAVILRGAERMDTTYMGFARMYARRLLGGRGNINRRWLWDLHPDGSEPTGWPRTVVVRGSEQPHPPWESYRTRWLNTYERAGEVVQMQLHNWRSWGPCEEVPDDWGGAMDHERAERIGLQLLECDDSVQNNFYVRPGR